MGATTTGTTIIAIKINAANETSKICSCVWMVHVQDHVNFLLSRFEAMWCEPITEPVQFLDGPFTFKWVNSESIVAKMTQEGIKQGHVLLP